MAKSKSSYWLLLALISGVIFWISWPPKYFTALIFIALVPLLIIEDGLYRRKTPKSTWKLFLYVFLALFVWNVLSTYWIYNASVPGAVSAVLINSVFMSVPFLLFHRMKKWTGRELSHGYLAALWISFEYIHLNWDLAWPWLNLGNVFAVVPNWVQWYEFTGTHGGSLWIWIINILVYSIISKFTHPASVTISRISIFIRSSILLAAVLLPLLLSHFIKLKVDALPESEKNAVIVQPNVDPYSEKFARGTFEDQILKLVYLSDSMIDEHTALVVWPETAISRPRDEDAINSDHYIRVIRSLLLKHPHVKLLSGMDSYRFYKEGEKLSPTARFYKYDSTYYESYNTAILLDASNDFKIYHKSKLVPGVEKMPYPKFFKFLENLVVDLGGTSGSLAQSAEASVFRIDEELTVAPIICYESVFGDYCGDYVLKGANLLAVITNDGWWGNTPGYEQHYLYARLRAIELRRHVVRAANTGISCYINSKGEVLQKTNWWTTDVIRHNITLNNKQTFYARNGDYIARISSFISVIILLVSLVRRLMNKNVFEKNV